MSFIFLAFAFVLFFIAAVFTSAAPHWNRLVAGGLAFLVAAQLFGGVATLLR